MAGEIVVIGQDVQTAQAFLGAWEVLTGTVETDHPLRDTVTDVEFPGALLTARSPNGLPIFYAVAQDARSWHRLAPLLTAFAGLTTTDFRGPPSSTLNPQNPLEQLIISSGCHAVARLQVTSTTASLADRSIRRLYLTWRQAPHGRQALLESTGTLLSRFHATLATFDAITARALLTQLEQERRLDALNLNFLEIVLCSALGDWSGLLALDSLPYVLVARRPPAVSVAIAEAVWHGLLAQVLERDGLDAAMTRYRSDARPLIAALSNVPRNTTPGVFALMAVAVLAGDLDVDILAEGLSGTQYDVLPPVLAQALQAYPIPQPTPLVVAAPSATLLATARAALLQAAQDGGLDTCQVAQKAVSALSPVDSQALFAQPAFRALWNALIAQAGYAAVPTAWADWIERLHHPEFTQFFTIAEQAAVEWRVFDQLGDPVTVKRLADAIVKIATGIASERLLLTLPVLVNWLRDDERFPITLHADLYLNLLTILTLHDAFGEDRMGMATVLYEAVLSCGLENSRYGDALDLALDLTERANGARYIDWLLDWASLTLAYPAADTSKRQQLLHRVVDILRPFAGSMLLRQCVLFVELAHTLGVSGIVQPAAPISTSTSETSNPLNRLAGKMIAIYTLTESTGRQAMALLQQLIPDVSVELNHDKVGNDRLQALARNADVFVVVAQSAKHAATLFIQRYRQSKPLLFPKGRGVSSILAILEAFCC